MKNRKSYRKFKLSNSTIAKIRQLEKKVKKPKSLKRLQFLLMKNKGDKHVDIAKLLGVRTETLSHWLAIFREGGLKKLLEWNYRGKIPSLTVEQQETLKDRLRHNGFIDAKEAKEFIEKRFDVHYHLNHVQKILKKIRTILQKTTSHSRQNTKRNDSV